MPHDLPTEPSWPHFRGLQDQALDYFGPALAEDLVFPWLNEEPRVIP